MQFLTDHQITKNIKNIISNSSQRRKPLNIAVAYWGESAIETLGLDVRVESGSNNVRVICDLMGGACNPSIIEELQKFRILVKTRNGMHAKVWICGTHVIVGSANASTNGLGFDGDNSVAVNQEAAVHLRDSKFAYSVNSWFDRLWDDEDSVLVNKDHLDVAKRLWRRRKYSGNRNQVQPKGSLLDRIRSSRINTQEFNDVKIVVWENDPRPDPKGLGDYLHSDKARKYYSDNEWDNGRDRSHWDCGNDRWQFKRNTTYLDFVYEQNSKSNPDFRGISRAVSPDGQHEQVGKSYIVLRYEEPDCKGYILTNEDKRQLKKMVQAHCEKENWKVDSAMNLIDLHLSTFVHNSDRSY